MNVDLPQQAFAWGSIQFPATVAPGLGGGSAPRPGYSAPAPRSSGIYPSEGMDIHARLDGIAGSITDLRERMGKAEVRIESMDRHMATKEHVRSAELSMIKWIVGAGLTIVGSLLGAMAKGFGWL